MKNIIQQRTHIAKMKLQVLFAPNLDQEIKNYYLDLEMNGPTEESGIDLPFPKTVDIPITTQTTLIGMGIHCRMVDDNGNDIPYTLHPRSSIYKTLYRLANSTGIIDKTYRGELKSPLDILNSNYHEIFSKIMTRYISIIFLISLFMTPSIYTVAFILGVALFTENKLGDALIHILFKDYYTITKGTRLIQLCAPDLQPITVEIVDSLPKSSRGSNGFGSTGTGLK